MERRAHPRPPRRQELAARPRREGASSRGFSLFELLVVLIVVSVMVSIAAPQIDVAEYQVRGAVREVGTTLLAAQRLAMARQHDVVVAFDTASRWIRIHEDANNSGEIDADERVRHHGLGESIVFGRGDAPPHTIGPAAVTFTRKQGELPAVTFHRDGSASEEGGFYLTSQRGLARGQGAKYARAVVIQRSTGRATWFRYGSSTWYREF